MPNYKHIPRLTPTQAKKEMKRLLASGYTPQEIKNITGVKSIQTVYNWSNGDVTAPMSLKAIKSK